jgi:hypothetical protein
VPAFAPLVTQAGSAAVGQGSLTALPLSPLHAAHLSDVPVVSQTDVVPAHADALATVHCPHVPFVASQRVPFALPAQSESCVHGTQRRVVASHFGSPGQSPP